jgi:hypothetical protein
VASPAPCDPRLFAKTKSLVLCLFWVRPQEPAHTTPFSYVPMRRIVFEFGRGPECRQRLAGPGRRRSEVVGAQAGQKPPYRSLVLAFSWVFFTWLGAQMGPSPLQGL